MICLVTDRHRLASDPSEAADSTDARLVELVASAARAGVDLIQVRERDLDTRRLTALVRRCVEATRGTTARILVNDRADVAIAAGAHGVHLRADSVAAPAIRTLLPPPYVVGRSVHGVAEAALAARGGGLDYLIFGTLFGTPSKPGDAPLTSVRELAEACRVSHVPVLAIGGITIDKSRDVAQAGAAGVAAIGMFVPPAGTQPDEYYRAVVTDLRRAFDTSRAVS